MFHNINTTAAPHNLIRYQTQNYQKVHKFHTNLIQVIRNMPQVDLLTYVAFPSRRKTHESVHSNLAQLIFFVVGLKSIVNWFWDDSMLAYLRILILNTANCLLFPVAGTCKHSPKSKTKIF